MSNILRSLPVAVLALTLSVQGHAAVSSATVRAVGYDAWGPLVRDDSRGITDISYDRFGNPLRISFSDGSYSENVYSASGEKLKSTHTTLQNGILIGKTTMEYRGNIIYRDGKVDMVLFPGGYATVSGSSVTFHYYTQDYLGNNRAVVNGSTGAIEQTVAYYPYGGVIADLGTNLSKQQYKFGGKELLTANGLNEYDFGARQYYSAVPAFTRIDPMAEKYPWLSPYLYCGNDPFNIVDMTGMYWNDPNEAEKLQKDIENKISSYQKDINKLRESIGNGNAKVETQISDLNQRIGFLKKSLSDIDLLGQDTQYTYTLSQVDGSGAHNVRLGEDGMVYIETSENALSVHEIAHVRQSKESSGDGTLEFDSKGFLKNPGTGAKGKSKQYMGISKSEIEAYRMQFSFDPRSMPNKVSNVGSIDVHYVRTIRTASGKFAYPEIHQFSNYIKKS
ncbi:MAG: hypothetical protein K2J78_04715 [Muribaculaceae bacterium]|nr:hypothetical protein [Muribaculaceae bacterium]